MSEALTASWNRTSWVNRANAALIVGLGGIVCLLLEPEWLHDPDLSHGFFMPFIFVFLLWEARNGPGKALPAKAWPLICLVGVVGIGFVAAAGLYAAALGWSASIVSFTMTAGYACLCLAAVMNFALAGVELITFNWAAFVACILWLLAAPIPPGTYSRLSLNLQLGISTGVLHTLHVLGVAARQQGNIIELSHAQVGIEDACSGVRSLVSCVYAGFFLSAVLPLSKLARAFLIGLSVPLALGMNFLRSLLLTLLVNHGVQIEGLWHDATGYAVLLVTAVILAGLAYLASRRKKEAAARPALSPRSSGIPAGAVLACLLLVTGLGIFSLVNTQPAEIHGTPPPDLLALLPSRVDGWKVETRDDLYQFAGTLRTNHLAERTYIRRTSAGTEEQVTLYLAYWSPGQAPVSLVAMHTPDACWPGTGWQAQPQSETQETPLVGDRTLPTAEYRLFAYQGFPQYVWFWHLYDGSPIAFRDPHGAVALLREVWTYGYRHDGDQLFVRVSANRPWGSLSQEPFIEGFFVHLHAFGL